jgi:hypothetical protein
MVHWLLLSIWPEGGNAAYIAKTISAAFNFTRSPSFRPIVAMENIVAPKELASFRENLIFFLHLNLKLGSLP